MDVETAALAAHPNGGQCSRNRTKIFCKKLLLKNKFTINVNKMKDILSLGSESPSLITSLQGGIFQVLRKVLFLEAGGSGCEILASPKLQQVQSYKCTKFLH